MKVYDKDGNFVGYSTNKKDTLESTIAFLNKYPVRRGKYNFGRIRHRVYFFLSPIDCPQLPDSERCTNDNCNFPKSNGTNYCLVHGQTKRNNEPS